MAEVDVVVNPHGQQHQLGGSSGAEHGAGQHIDAVGQGAALGDTDMAVAGQPVAMQQQQQQHVQVKVSRVTVAGVCGTARVVPIATCKQ